MYIINSEKKFPETIVYMYFHTLKIFEYDWTADGIPDSDDWCSG